MIGVIKICQIISLAGLMFSSPAFAQVTYPRSVESAIQQGLNLRIAREGQQVVFGEIESASNQVNRNAIKTYSSYHNAQEKIPQEVVDQYEDLLDIVWNIARLNAMDKGVYAQVANAVQMQTLLNNQKTVKNNIFKICSSSGVLCDPYVDFIGATSSSSDTNQNSNTSHDLKPSESNSHTRTGFLISETKQGSNKVCYYNVVGSTYAHNTSSFKICPISMKF